MMAAQLAIPRDLWDAHGVRETLDAIDDVWRAKYKAFRADRQRKKRKLRRKARSRATADDYHDDHMEVEGEDQPADPNLISDPIEDPRPDGEFSPVEQSEPEESAAKADPPQATQPQGPVYGPAPNPAQDPVQDPVKKPLTADEAWNQPKKKGKKKKWYPHLG